MATQDTATFWDSLARVLAGQNQAQIPTVQKDPGGGIFAGWKGAMQNPEARGRIQDLALGLMMSNSGNPFTDVGSAVQFSRQNMEQRRQQLAAEEERRRKQAIEERQVSAYEKQVDYTKELGELRNQTQRDIAEIRGNYQLRAKILEGQNALALIKAKADAGAYGQRGKVDLQGIMYEGLLASGYTPVEASMTIQEYQAQNRALAGSLYASPPGPIDQAIAESQGTTAPTRSGLPPNATPQQKTEAMKGNRPPIYVKNQMIVHKEQGVQYQVTDIKEGQIEIMGPNGVKAWYPKEAVDRVFTADRTTLRK